MKGRCFRPQSPESCFCNDRPKALPEAHNSYPEVFFPSLNHQNRAQATQNPNRKAGKVPDGSE